MTVARIQIVPLGSDIGGDGGKDISAMIVLPGTLLNGGFVPKAFVGPLDSLPAPAAAYALRRQLSSYTANKAIHVTGSGGATSGDIGFTATGDFDVTRYNTLKGSGTLAVDKWYDQSGNGRDASQATGTAQPAVTLNSTGRSRAVMTFAAANSQFLQSSATLTANQPVTLAAYAERTTVSKAGIISISDVAVVCIDYDTSANTLLQFAGLSANATASDNAYHAITSVFNGASSSVVVDSTTTATSPGTNNPGTTTIFLGNQSGNDLTGNIAEAVIWTSGLSAGNISTYNTNLANYY